MLFLKELFHIVLELTDWSVPSLCVKYGADVSPAEHKQKSWPASVQKAVLCPSADSEGFLVQSVAFGLSASLWQLWSSFSPVAPGSQ